MMIAAVLYLFVGPVGILYAVGFELVALDLPVDDWLRGLLDPDVY
jgi:hypothetical protein